MNALYWPRAWGPRTWSLVLVVWLLGMAGASAADRVAVRVGEHPGFSRLVFDWGRPVRVQLAEAPGLARLRFERVGDLDLARFHADPPPGISRIASKTVGDALVVTVTIASDAKVRLMDSEGNVVLDVLAPDTPLDAPAARMGDAAPSPPKFAKSPKSAPTPTPAPAVAAPKQTQGPELERPNAPIRLLPSLPEAPPGATDTAPGPAAKDAPKESTARPALATRPPAVTPPLAPRPRIKPIPPPAPEARAEAKSGKKTEAKALPRVAEKKDTTVDAAPAPAPVHDPAATPVPGNDTASAATTPEKSRAPGPDAAPARRIAGVLVRAAPAPTLIDNTLGPTQSRQLHTSSELRFQWDGEVGIAVYRQGPHLWIAFDRPPPGDLASGIAELAPEVAPVRQFEVPGGTLLRLSASPIVVPRVIKDGTAWVVDLWPRGARPEPTIDVEVDSLSSSDALFALFQMLQPGRVLTFRAPGLDTRMAVVPSRQQDEGLAPGQSFPQFSALPSTVGLAMVLRGDGVLVGVGEDGVRVTHPAGLIASHGPSLALLKDNVPKVNVGPGLLDMAAWRRAGGRGFTPALQALQATLVKADPPHAMAARLDLVRFYFAHGLTPEAMVMLGLGTDDNPVLIRDPEERLMRGISAFLAGNYDSAARDLFHPSMLGEAEARLWHGAMAAVSQDWAVAAADLDSTAFLIDRYPHRVRMHLRLLAAEARLEMEDADGAGAYLQAARRDDPEPTEEARIAYLKGRQLLLGGDEEGARALWERLAEFPDHSQAVIRARVALLDLARQQETITDKQAIEELERLRFAWRGDYFERNLLKRLAELYIADGRFREGLRAYRRAASNFPNSRRSQRLARRMREVFHDLYVGPLREKVPPLRAAAIYEEFKELTPPGARGDSMIAGLAERLVDVDLLDRAAQLLSTQVKFRLSGAAKARTGMRLAQVHMLDEAPIAALDALDISAEPDLPKELARERKLVRVEALTTLHRYDEAMALLGTDASPEALRMRARMLWAQEKWPAAAVALERMVPKTPPPKRPLEERERQDVIDLAVALTMTRDRAKLAELNKAYGQAMATGPDAETFALLTDGLQPGADASIADKLAEVDKARAFVDSYRQRVQQAGVGG